MWFKLLCDGWFSFKVSTEAPMRGTIKEAQVLAFVKALSIMHVLYGVGMITSRDEPHLARPQEVVSLVKAN